MKLLNRRNRLMTTTTNGDNEQEMTPDEVLKFAPKRNQPRLMLTAEMLAPGGKVGDPMRLAQMAAPTVEKIGISTADHIEEAAASIVTHAETQAQALVDDAHRQAEKMVEDAKIIASDMLAYATGIRAYTMAKSVQVSNFCSMAESVMGSMLALNDHFTGVKKQDEEKLPEVPKFVKREAPK